MREHGHDLHRIEPGMQDRPAGGQRVGGRPRRRRDEQPVGALFVDELVVDGQLEVHHPRHAAGMDDDIVERNPDIDDLAVAMHMRLKKKPIFHREGTRHDPRDLLGDLVGRDVGEKAQAAAVDPEYRNARVRHIACHAEDAPISPDHHDEVDALAHRRPWNSGREREHLRGSSFEHQLDARRSKRGQDDLQRVDHVGTATSAHDGNALEIGHRPSPESDFASIRGSTAHSACR